MPARDISRAVHQSVAERFIAMLARMGFGQSLVFTGEWNGIPAWSNTSAAGWVWTFVRPIHRTLSVPSARHFTDLKKPPWEVP